MFQGLQKKIGFAAFLALVFFTGPVHGTSRADVFVGQVRTGMLQLEDHNYPVMLYVPDHYDGKRPFSLIISLPGDFEDIEEHLKEWKAVATRQSLIVVVSDLKLRGNDVPYNADRWLLNVVEDVERRYRIAPQKVFLIGKDANAHYAAYLGINFPGDFNAVGLLNGSWVGPYSKLIRFHSRPSRQVPFFVSLKAEQDPVMAATEDLAQEMVRKGYPVYLEKLETNEDFTSGDFKRRMLDWLEEKAQNWQVVIEEDKKSMGEKVSDWFEQQTTEIQ